MELKTNMLKNKKALVTGSSRGIGRKIVEVFLANGAEVWGLCSKPSAAKEELEKYAEENADPINAAKNGFVDNIIEPQFVRPYVISALQMIVR